MNVALNPASTSVATAAPLPTGSHESVNQTEATPSEPSSDAGTLAPRSTTAIDAGPDAGAWTGQTPVDHVAPVRVENWPAGGRELTLRVVPEQAAATLLSSNVELTNAEGAPLGFELAATALGPGYTGILLRAATEQERSLVAASAKQFIDSRPAEERLALFEWREQVRQMVGFTLERERLTEALAIFEAESVADTLAAAELAPRIVAEQTAIVGGSAPRVMRSAVVLSATPLSFDSASSKPESVLIEYPTLTVDDASAAEVAVAAASDHIDRVAESGHVRLSLCGTVDAQTLELRDANARLGALLVPATLPEQQAGECDPSQIGPGLRRYPERVALAFSEAERAEYDTRVADHDDSEFNLSVQFDASQEPVPAKAKLHGQTSLSCERKSYTVNLEGALERPLLRESAINEFYLISMCLDDFYVHQVTAESLLSPLGLFGLEGNLVEVSLDGESRGVYWLLEKTREELTRDNSAVTVVLRRDTDHDDHTVWEAKGTDTPDYDIADITAFMTSVLEASEETRAAAFGRQMNLQAYLTWLAVNSALENGDYVDELWLFGSAMVNDAGESSTWYTLESWDPDDTFKECHTGDRVAWPDPYGLAYCAEAELDAALLSTPTIYAKFVDVLESLLDGALSQDHFDAAAAQTRERLVALLQTPDAVAAMEQFETDDPSQAAAMIDDEIARMSQAFAERRDQLRERIATYRAEVASADSP